MTMSHTEILREQARRATNLAIRAAKSALIVHNAHAAKRERHFNCEFCALESAERQAVIDSATSFARR